MMPEDAEAPPFGKILAHIGRRRCRLQPQGVTAEIDRFATVSIEGMVKLRRKGGKRVAGIELGCARGLGWQGSQPAPERGELSPGEAITVPHTAQVRCSMFEKNR